MPTREFDLLKAALPPLIQLTAAAAAATWVVPHVVTFGAAGVMAAILGGAIRRGYQLILEEEVTR
jgi:hypothetical protein